MNFDRVADIYDTTRGLPDVVVERIAERVMLAIHASPQTRFLELGIGTGRIALPFVLRGLPYTGVDISDKMMAGLREKVGEAPNLTLLNADVTHIPLPDSSVDVVITVHLLHLVPEWQAALAEAGRVLRPGGYFVEGHDWPLPGDPGQSIRNQWRQTVEEVGGTAELRPHYGGPRRVQAELIAQGWWPADYVVARWQRYLRPLELMEQQRDRTFSMSWGASDRVLQETHQRMLAWGQEEFGDLDRPLPSTWEFVLSVYQRPAP